jgi:hypothetical protein
MTARTYRTSKNKSAHLLDPDRRHQCYLGVRLADNGRTSYYQWRKVDEMFTAETDAAIGSDTNSPGLHP